MSNLENYMHLQLNGYTLQLQYTNSHELMCENLPQSVN